VLRLLSEQIGFHLRKVGIDLMGNLLKSCFFLQKVSKVLKIFFVKKIEISSRTQLIKPIKSPGDVTQNALQYFSSTTHLKMF
jgi:hypothetical protein